MLMSVMSGRMGMVTLLSNMEFATHHLVIWAMFSLIYGRSIVKDGAGCIAITARARRQQRPHSLERGW